MEAEKARIDDLVADNVTIKEQLTADSADIRGLKAKDVTIEGKLTAAEADIENLETKKLDASVADIKYATIENLNTTNADVHNLTGDFADFKVATIDRLDANDASIESLQTNKLDAKDAAIKYANIDFSNINEAAVQKLFSDSGIIKDLIVSEGKITGELVGVTIKGDLIEGGTVVADKLVVKGENGLYYKLNTDGVTTEAEQTDYNSLNGQIITAKSITATKIAVDDLVAFGATIGGFKISTNSIYSGVKESVNNTTRGIYMDSQGQIAVGDSQNFIKYYKDDNGDYRLEISAKSIKFGASNASIEDAISDSKMEITREYSSLINETASQISSTVDELSRTVNANSDSIVHINNSINVTSQDINLVKTTMSNIQNAVNGKVSSDEIKEWARFDGATLELGASNQPFKARLTTTELAFYQGSNKVAWISNNELHILTAIITQSIGVGNFTFVDEGSMGFSLL